MDFRQYSAMFLASGNKSILSQCVPATNALDIKDWHDIKIYKMIMPSHSWY